MPSYRRRTGDRITYTRDQTVHYKSKLLRWREGQRLSPMAILSQGDNRVLKFATRREATGAWTVTATRLDEPIDPMPGTSGDVVQIAGYGNPPPGWDAAREPRYYVRSLARDRCWFSGKGNWIAHPPAAAVLYGRVASDTQTYGFISAAGAEVTERFAYFTTRSALPSQGESPGADPPAFPVVGVRTTTACVDIGRRPALALLETRLETTDGTTPTPIDNGRRWLCVCNCPDKTRTEGAYASPYPSTGLNRDWSFSQAGADGYCKHEVAAYRALGNPLPEPGVIDIRFEFERPPRSRSDFPDYGYRESRQAANRSYRRRRSEFANASSDRAQMQRLSRSNSEYFRNPDGSIGRRAARGSSGQRIYYDRYGQGSYNPNNADPYAYDNSAAPDDQY